MEEDSEHDLALLAGFTYPELGEATAQVLAPPRPAAIGPAWRDPPRTSFAYRGNEASHERARCRGCQHRSPARRPALPASRQGGSDQLNQDAWYVSPLPSAACEPLATRPHCRQ